MFLYVLEYHHPIQMIVPALGVFIIFSILTWHVNYNLLTHQSMTLTLYHVTKGLCEILQMFK